MGTHLSIPNRSDELGAGGGAGTLILLSIVLVLTMTTWFSASAVLPQLREAWDLSDGEAAWLTVAVQLGFVAGALTSSVLNASDVIPPMRLLAAGALGAAASNLAIVAVDGPGPAIALRAATGFFLAGVYPSALKQAATWFRKARGLALGVLVGALTVGSAAPHLVNGLGGLDTDTVLVVTSVSTLIGGALALLVRDGPYPFPRAAFDPRQARMVFANRGVRLASLGYFGHMWELYAMWAWFLLFFRDVSNNSGGSAPALATFAVIGIGGLGCVVGGLLGDRWGRPRTTTVMMIASAVCAIAIGLVSTAPGWVILAVGLIWGFAVVGDSAQFSAMVTEQANQSYVGTALTLQLALGFTLTVATIWLVPMWEEAFGWRWAFAFLAPGPIVGVMAMLRLERLPERTTATPVRP
jgi:MFS family permease